jgi:RNA polymerase sigma-70 factor (ECF subfamily)
MGVSELDPAVAPASADLEDVFHMLVDEYGRSLYQLAYRLTGNDSDARDVLQEGFFRAYQRWSQFEGRANPGTWLHRIVVNCALDLFRRTRARPDRRRPQRVDDYEPVLASRGANPERLAASSEWAHHIEHALQSLTPLERATFVLRHFDGCSIAEISESVGLNGNAVKQHIYRAVRKLRTALTELGANDGTRQRI